MMFHVNQGLRPVNTWATTYFDYAALDIGEK